jgi:acetyl esterase/lipase
MEEYHRLVEILKTNGKLRTERGTDILYKVSPDGEEGYLDKREALVGHADEQDIRKNPQNYPQNIVDNADTMFPVIGEADRYEYNGIPVGVLRKKMGWINCNMHPEILTENLFIHAEGEERDIPVKCYQKAGKEKNRPCLIFIHGGGFIAGSVEVVENPCKGIADKANAVVLSVDYRLAPEHPFPAGLDDCMNVIKWAFENAEKLGIDPNKIGVAGDSAGGNLAAACTLKDRDEQAGRIRYQALLYATLMRGNGSDHPGYSWKLENYKNKANDPYITNAAAWIRDCAPMIDICYVQEADCKNPYISPVDARDKSGLPKTLICTAEYDYLRAECDYYARLLKEAGTSVRNICYGGVGHAFLDKYGFYPQAEDCVEEIAKDLRNL